MASVPCPKIRIGLRLSLAVISRRISVAKKDAPNKARNQPLHVPLPFDAFVTGILKVDPKKLKGKPPKKGKKPKPGRKPPAA
jgi:hypothetical protein